MRARLARRHAPAREAPPPPAVAEAIGAVVRLVAGEKADLSGIALDMDGVPPFEARVYERTRAIPPGATATYGEVAIDLGGRQLARDVGQALGRNPFAIVVPCHRVVAAGGKKGGFSAVGGTATKLRLLEIEARAAGDILPLRLPFPAPRP
jgi:methylated-DNA-[protein]-cysteine S-methyltransferase